MKPKLVAAILAIVSALIFTSTVAWADPLPDAQFSALAYNANGGVGIGQPGSVSGAYCVPDVGCLSDSAAVGGNFASASASSSGLSALPSAQVIYYVRVDGPGGLAVPLDVKGNFSSTAGGSGLAYAGMMMGLNVNFGEELALGGNGFETCAGNGCADTQCLQNCVYPITDSLSLDTTVSLAANTPSVVILFARCGAFTSGDSCGALADPMFSIDPTFSADHPGYSLEFSSGVLNTDGGGGGGVPEPATWALAIVGFGLMGAEIRRRRVAA